MGTHAESPVLRPPRADGARTSFDHHWRLVLVAIVIALGAFLAIFLVHHKHEAEHDAILRMNPETRRAIFDEARQNAELLCAQAASESALSDRCIETAHFLRAFPECDAACDAFVRLHDHQATR